MGRNAAAATGRALDVRDLSVGYGATVVVGHATFGVPYGQILTLIGPNGAGKSTLLRTIARQLSPIAGQALLDGHDLAGMDAKRLARTMAILTTERVSPELMTCEDVVSTGRYPHTGRLGILHDADRRAVARAMELVGIEALAEVPFSRVSDGQRQRTMIARAICQEPRVLVLDEPTSFLDIRHKLEFLRLVRRLAHEDGIAVVMSLHELELARSVSDVVACVANGRVDRVAPARDVFANGYIRRLYDVDDPDFDAIYPGLDAGVLGPGTVRSGQVRMRRGITTGTCAALATAAATRLLLCGEAPQTVRLVTPKGVAVEAQVAYARRKDGSATCGVRKDAGDDPDVTDGVVVEATVARTEGGVLIEGGAGVGRVTLPGLDQPVGSAAINRVPRRMIEEQARAVAGELGYGGGLAVTISVPGGELLAQRTFNPNLGVVGGLSILGTSGIEEPRSEEALVRTIELELAQVRAQGADRVLLLPGNYAKDFVGAHMPELAHVARVTYANYLGDALDAAVEQGFLDVLFVGHIGKLVKLAGGITNTHSKVADCRVELLCAHGAVCGADADLCARILQAATTDAALDLLDEAELLGPVVDSLLAAMQRHLDRRAHGELRAGAVVFSNQRGLLGMTVGARDILRRITGDAEEERP